MSTPAPFQLLIQRLLAARLWSTSRVCDCGERRGRTLDVVAMDYILNLEQLSHLLMDGPEWEVQKVSSLHACSCTDAVIVRAETCWRI